MPSITTTTSSAPSPFFSSSRYDLVSSAFRPFKSNARNEFRQVAGGLEPFHSLHSTHLFVHWLSSLPIRKYLSSDLLLVVWAVNGLPAGLKGFLQWSLTALEAVPEEKVNLEYLMWQLEMWRSIFSSTKVVEYARKNGWNQQGTTITDWFWNSGGASKAAVQNLAQGYWGRLSGTAGMYSSSRSGSYFHFVSLDGLLL
jgi:hypothetical protein